MNNKYAYEYRMIEGTDVIVNVWEWIDGEEVLVDCD